MKLELHIHLHHHYEDSKMSEAIDNLTAAVAENNSKIDSAITLIEGLADQVEQLKEDPVALQALADEIRGKAAALGSAIDQNDGDPSTPPAPQE